MRKTKRQMIIWWLGIEKRRSERDERQMMTWL